MKLHLSGYQLSLRYDIILCILRRRNCSQQLKDGLSYWIQLDLPHRWIGGSLTMLVVTFTSLGLASQAFSTGRFFPARSFLGVIFGSRM